MSMWTGCMDETTAASKHLSDGTISNHDTLDGLHADDLVILQETRGRQLRDRRRGGYDVTTGAHGPSCRPGSPLRTEQGPHARAQQQVCAPGEMVTSSEKEKQRTYKSESNWAVMD